MDQLLIIACSDVDVITYSRSNLMSVTIYCVLFVLLPISVYGFSLHKISYHVNDRVCVGKHPVFVLKVSTCGVIASNNLRDDGFSGGGSHAEYILQKGVCNTYFTSLYKCDRVILQVPSFSIKLIEREGKGY